MISFVVYATGRITCYSVNMLRWAGRASLVIMNQEENSLNTDTGSEDSYNVNVLVTALGGAKLLYKFTLLAKATDINLVNETPIGTKPNDCSGTDYLSPNSLLLGRCSERISSGPFQGDAVFTDDPKVAHSRFL